LPVVFTALFIDEAGNLELLRLSKDAIWFRC